MFVPRAMERDGAVTHHVSAEVPGKHHLARSVPYLHLSGLSTDAVNSV